MKGLAEFMNARTSKFVFPISALSLGILSACMIAGIDTNSAPIGLGSACFIVGSIWFCVGAGLWTTNVKRGMYDRLDAGRGLLADDMKHEFRGMEVGTSAGFSFDHQAGNKKYIRNSLYYGIVIALTGVLFLVAGYYLGSQ